MENNECPISSHLTYMNQLMWSVSREKIGSAIWVFDGWHVHKTSSPVCGFERAEELPKMRDIIFFFLLFFLLLPTPTVGMWLLMLRSPNEGGDVEP